MSMGGVTLFFLLVIFYFLPSVISGTRNTQHGFAIVLINLLLGWTMIGWVAALLWAIMGAPTSEYWEGPFALSNQESGRRWR